jgi:opacity protein-like surface antigen
MQTRAYYFFTVLLIAGIAMASPAGAAGVEITPFAGYTGGGDFTNVNTGQSLSFDETSSYGILLGFKQAPDPKQPGTAWLELYLSRQQTKLRANQSFFTGSPSLNVDVEYYHIGGTYGQAEGKVQPFVAGTLGATRMAPQQYGLSAETMFSLTLGGGVKVYLTEHVGLRLEGRWLGTLVNGSGGVFCSNGACLVTVQGNVLSQYTANAGVILAF